MQEAVSSHNLILTGSLTTTFTSHLQQCNVIHMVQWCAFFAALQAAMMKIEVKNCSAR